MSGTNAIELFAFIDMRAAGARGEQLGLSEAELAFYDALEVNDGAVKVLGDDTLRTIARELEHAEVLSEIWAAA